jgi:methylase of polypeptide subunit release factors
MTHVSEGVCSILVPKLLGSYEAELHPVLDQVIRNNYETIIDVGCAEGYYAVGLALSLPTTHVHAFDIDSRARELCTIWRRPTRSQERVIVEGECR